MSYMRFETCAPLSPWREAIGRAPGAGQRRRGRNRQAPVSGWVPAVDIREEQDRYLVCADLPGVEPAAIEVSTENGVLCIKGKRSGHQQDQQACYGSLRRVERVHGSFVRRFSLPEGADADAVSATSRHGVLEIVIPKRPELRVKRIRVSD